MPAWKIAQLVVSNEEKTRVWLIPSLLFIVYEALVLFSTNTRLDEEEYNYYVDTHEISPKCKHALLPLYP